MTANQIEYWKLQETKRHNIATEEMDRPVKQSQAEYNYASIGLINEQAKTQETVRAANLASAYASYAAGQLSYEKINTEQTQQALNYEKSVTEQYNQNLIESKKAGQDISNVSAQYGLVGAQREALVEGYRIDDLSWDSKYHKFLGSQANFKDYAGYNLGTLITSASSYASIFK